MDEYVEEYLLMYGFNTEQINHIKTNPYISQVTKKHLMNIIKYLEEIQISKDIIIKILYTNKWLISENYYRINYIEELFKKLGFNNNEYKIILEANFYTLTINPKELIKTLNYMKSKNESVNIKKFILENPNIISEKFIATKKLIDSCNI